MLALLLLTAVEARYRGLAHVCMPWAPNLTQVGDCGVGHSPCDVAWLQEQCDNFAGCNAFDSNGLLFSCPDGHCGCDSGNDFCLRGQDIANDPRCMQTDLYFQEASPPYFLVAGIKNGSVLYTNPDPNICYMPEIGNGFLASVMGSDAMYIAGLYNGMCGTTHRARLPSTLLLDIKGASREGSALDMLHAVFLRWWRVGSSLIEQRTYAHRTRRNLFVTEFLVRDGPDVAVVIQSPFDPLHQRNDTAGTGCAGDFTIDFDFKIQNSSVVDDVLIANGVSNLQGDKNESFLVSIVTSNVSSNSIPLKSTSSVYFFTVLTSSVEGYNTTQQVQDAAISVFVLAAKHARALWAEHTTAWAELYQSGIDVEVDWGSPMEAMGSDVMSHVNSSLYFLLSSVRADWSPGVSPGGAATQNYQGAVFMDMELWMGPALTLFVPELQASMFEYRYNSISASRDIAILFGFKGAMFAWTAAYLGRAFGCCQGTGGYEECLEQHVTPDVGFAAWQYYQATRNDTWLKTRGYPLLQQIAEFLMSRVTAKSNEYWITGIMPIDEWCANTDCGCPDPGVDNDAQMNGASIASLLGAGRAAEILGVATPRTAQYLTVGQNIILLFNSSGGGHHNQFNSPECPGGWGGGHYVNQTICPEDVLLLSYPFGDMLETSPAVTRADAELFVPLTCMENAGMTTPIHTIVWLSLFEGNKAQAEFNRSLYAACYGPFNVRNEVDKHVDIPGAHYDNSHFLTGDGGYLQALVNGFGGLRITEKGLRLLKPSLPTGARRMRLRRVLFRSLVLNIVVARESVDIQGSLFCLEDAKGDVKQVKHNVSLNLSNYSFPGLIYEC